MAQKVVVGKAKQQDPTKVPAGIDAATYFAPAIPDEIKMSMPLFHKSSNDILRSLTMKIVDFMLNPDSFSLDQNAFGNDVNQDHINFLLTSIFLVLRIAVRTKSKVSVIKNDLAAMNFPKDFVDDICKSMVRFRLPVESSVTAKRITFPKLEKLRWRIDITISSGSLSRVMRPNIMMQLILSNGKVYTFEVSIEQFNQLRYNVAKVLQDMQTLERHPILKIINEFKRREEEDYNN